MKNAWSLGGTKPFVSERYIWKKSSKKGHGIDIWLSTQLEQHYPAPAPGLPAAAVQGGALLQAGEAGAGQAVTWLARPLLGGVVID